MAAAQLVVTGVRPPPAVEQAVLTVVLRAGSIDRAKVAAVAEIKPIGHLDLGRAVVNIQRGGIAAALPGFLGNIFGAKGAAVDPNGGDQRAGD